MLCEILQNFQICKKKVPSFFSFDMIDIGILACLMTHRRKEKVSVGLKLMMLENFRIASMRFVNNTGKRKTTGMRR